MKITQVNSKWYIGRLPGAAFFGRTMKEITIRANDWRKANAPEIANQEVRRPVLRLVKNG